MCLLNAQQVCEKLRLSMPTVRKALKSGDIPGRKIGQKWFVSQEALEKLISTPTQPQSGTAE
jgi:excisionase family DNA binding protein